jgi:nucleoside-diphosphate-sugar epimerase
MRMLVIGGSGFIGKYVVSELANRGHEIGVLGRGHASSSAAHMIVGDRNRLGDSRDAIREFAPEVVIDMITGSGTQARALVDVVGGLVRRTIVLSSMDVYRAVGVVHGSEPGPLEPLPLTERSALRTTAQTYPPAQIATLQAVFGWFDDEYNKVPVEATVRTLDATVLRLPMVYGPGDRLRRLYPVVKRIIDGRRALVFSESLAAWRGSRGYVEDVARAIALAATSDAAIGRTYNIAELDAPSELEWARLVAARMQWDGEFVVLPDVQTPAHLRRPGNAAQHWIADSTRIRDELGYAEVVTRDEAIDRTIAWERETPPGSFMPHAFDYAAEDAALAGR